MSHLSDWSKVIQEQGEREREKQAEREAQMLADLPIAIDGLSSKPADKLVDLAMEYSGSAFYPTEAALRQKFRDAIKAELLRRLATPERESGPAESRLREAMEALRPFANCVFTDNGDVTLNLACASHNDYLRARAFVEQEKDNG